MKLWHRTWTVHAPEAVLKRLPAREAVSVIGVILRGQFYIYDVCRKRVKEMNKNLKQGSKPLNVRAPKFETRALACMLNAYDAFSFLRN